MPNQPTNQSISALCNALEKAYQSHCEQSDSGHDLHHARRVWLNAQSIAAKSEASDERILCAACFLHDLVNVPKNSPLRSQASTLSAQAAKPILAALEFNADDSSAVQHCIEAHSYSAAITPQTLEARILQDADRLESVGALGIARTFFTAGKMDSQLFNADDPFAQHRTLDDIQFAVDHFKKKLLTLADTMQTEAGKKLATERTTLMRNFLNALAEELGVEQPW